MPHLDNHRLYILGGIVFSAFLVFIAITIASQRSSLFSRASAPAGGSGTSSSTALLSRENSYLFVSPVSAEANGTSIVRATVFLLNSQGLGITGQSVQLKTSGRVTVSQITPLSDNFGKATFDLTSSTPGDYTISAEVGGVVLPQTVSVSFH